MINVQTKDKTSLTSISNIDIDLFNFNIDSDSPYLYFYSLGPVPCYFKNNKNIGFKDLDESVKNDIKSGKCNLVIYAGDEGYFGTPDDEEILILNKWILDEKFPPYSVHFICMNLIINEVLVKKNIKIKGHSFVSNSENYLTFPDVLCTKNFYDIGFGGDSKLFLNYNRTISRMYRLYLLLNLIKTNLISYGIISFGLKLTRQIIDVFFKTHSQNEFDDAIISKAINSTPLEINNLAIDESSGVVRAEFLGKLIIVDDYKNSFLSLVSETLTSTDTIYLSEKIFKPIMVGHPFMLISSKNSLKKLKEFGYKTFDKWWDESYDECDTYHDRITMISDELLKLKNKSTSELLELRNDMLDVIKHNQQLYKKRINETEELDNIIKNIYKNLLNENNISYGL